MHTIRDLSTGQLFALCKDTPSDGGNERSGSQFFTDFASGKELSAEEMDIMLGLRPNVSEHACLAVLAIRPVQHILT